MNHDDVQVRDFSPFREDYAEITAAAQLYNDSFNLDAVAASFGIFKILRFFDLQRNLCASYGHHSIVPMLSSPHLCCPPNLQIYSPQVCGTRRRRSCYIYRHAAHHDCRICTCRHAKPMPFEMPIMCAFSDPMCPNCRHEYFWARIG